MSDRLLTLRSAHLFAADLKAARRLYVDILEMPLLFETDGYLGLDAGECGLMIFQSDVDPARENQTCLHFGVKEIDSLVESLKAKGVRFHGEPWSEGWGGRLATFDDGQGNILHLVQYPD